MKQLIIIAAIVLSSSVIFAQKTVNEYVITKDGPVFYEQVNYGVFNFLKGKIDGEKTTYTKEEVLEYKKDGQVYTKRPKIVDNKITDQQVFMKPVTYQNGLILYEYETTTVNGKNYTEFYIFKNDEFVVDVNDNNYMTLIDFFSGKVIRDVQVAVRK